MPARHAGALALALALALTVSTGAGMLRQQPRAAAVARAGATVPEEQRRFQADVEGDFNALTAELDAPLREMKTHLAKHKAVHCLGGEDFRLTAHDLKPRHHEERQEELCTRDDPMTLPDAKYVYGELRSISMGLRQRDIPAFCASKELDSGVHEACQNARLMNSFGASFPAQRLSLLEKSSETSLDQKARRTRRLLWGSQPQSQESCDSAHRKDSCLNFASTGELIESVGNCPHDLLHNINFNPTPPEMAILGVGANVGVAVAGGEMVFDFFKLESGVFYYGGWTMGASSQFSLGANVYFMIGWKGKNHHQCLGEAYKGCFYGSNLLPSGIPVVVPYIGKVDVNIPFAVTCETDGTVACGKDVAFGVSLGKGTSTPWDGYNIQCTDYKFLQGLDCKKRRWKKTCFYLSFLPFLGSSPVGHALGLALLAANQALA